MTRPVDLVIVGGGTAGIIAAQTAGALGARVVLVERDRTGGDCLWTGCVPSKALLAAASAVHAMRSASRFVTNAVEPEVDFAAVLAHVRGAIKQIEPVDSPAALTRAGAEVVPGVAVFTGPREVQVDGRRLPFRHALLATGSEPVLPAIPGLAESGALTTATVWGLAKLPRRLVVLGGGAVGCELGQAFARLGTAVTLVEAADRLLPREEPAAAAALAARLTAEGVRVLTAATVTKVGGTRGAVDVTVLGSDGAQVLGTDEVLVAAGRHPRTSGLGLDTAGVLLDEHGSVAVDARLRSSNRRIYAAGDVTGGPAFTHVAGLHGSVAATNALLGPFRRINHDILPWVTFTDPEIAQVGLTEAAARQRHGSGVRTRSLAHAHVDRAITEADADGFTQVVLDAAGRVLGATIVAPRAGEMIAELAAVLARGGRLREVSGVVHAYPTWADGVWNAALAETRASLSTPGMRRVSGLMVRLRRATSRR